MKNFLFINIFVLFIGGLLYISCEKITTYSDRPEIKFKSFNIEKVKDTLGNLLWKGVISFEFIDGNGADLLNANEGDTLYSIHFQSFFKINCNYIKTDFDTLTSYFIYDSKMKISKTGQNKSLIGEIQITRLYYKKEKDTLKYEFYIIDREGNKSNIEQTSDGIFK